MSDPEPPTMQDPSLGLALAVVAASTAPLVLLDADLTVVAASASFCLSFDVDCETACGRSFFALGAGEWDARQLRSLLELTASGDAQIDTYEFSLRRPGQPTRTLVLNAQKLAYGDQATVRLLLAVSDVTEARSDARAKADLSQENAVLLQEVRHRVANSLQIIASVLLQSARRSQSDEVRGHLRNAHHRLMSVASLERELASASLGDVEIKSYLTKLCVSISNSMISDPKVLQLKVVADGSEVNAVMSVSMGLLVTELIINSLKHGYPEPRPGTITVSFASTATGWRLSVGDDGVGIQAGVLAARAGLGTSIINALAKQLKAEVLVTDANPGTLVTILHDGAEAASAELEEMAV